MLDIDVSETDVTVVDLSIPAPATRRDVLDLINAADSRYREMHPDDPHLQDGAPLYDDAYSLIAVDGRLVARLIDSHGSDLNF